MCTRKNSATLSGGVMAMDHSSLFHDRQGQFYNNSANMVCCMLKVVCMATVTVTALVGALLFMITAVHRYR